MSDRGTCACLDTSGGAARRQPSTRPTVPRNEATAVGGMRSKAVAARSNDAGGGGSRARRGASLALTRLPNPRILRRPCIRDIHPAIPLRISLPSVAVRSFPFRPVQHIPPRFRSTSSLAISSDFTQSCAARKDSSSIGASFSFHSSRCTASFCNSA